MQRRFFLKGAVVAGCSLAAHPFLTTLTLAEAPGEARLVVIILRGAMDGLDVVRPWGDRDFVALRPTLAAGDRGPDLDGFFGLHPALSGLMPLWQAGEVGFAHAVSTPYRDKRSHFDGQDLLEAGTGMDVPIEMARDGWLNRLLAAMPGRGAETAYAIGRDALPLLAGAAPVRSWTPEVRLRVSDQNRRLLDHLYHDDPLFRQAAAEAIDLAADGVEDRRAARGNGAEPAAPGFVQVDRLADFAALRLREGTRIAAFSQTGWDTHVGQRNGIAGPLSRLERTILRLRVQLGPVWGQTTVLAMTEFGRTARENGSRGTDHGTGGVMLLAGGAIRGGRVAGPWPGLAEAQLYDRRDLMPVADVRAHAAWALRALYGLDRGLLETGVFPGLDMGADPGLIR